MNSNYLDRVVDRFEEATSGKDFGVQRTAVMTLQALDNDSHVKIALEKMRSAGFDGGMTIEDYLRSKVEPVVEEQDLPLRLELRQLVWSRSKCCWPTGDPKKNGFVFCGDTVVPGKPYCLPHCKEAYTTSRDAS